jgi:heavy metal sensor kinase
VVFITTRSNLYRAIDDDLSYRATFLAKLREGERPKGAPNRFQGRPPESRSNPNIDPIQRERLEFVTLLTRPRIYEIETKSFGPPEDKAFDDGMLQLSLKGRRLIEYRRLNGHRVRILSIPLMKSGKIVGAAQFAASVDDIDEVINRLRSILLAILPLSLFVIYFLSAWLTRRALRPVREIAEAALQFEATNLSGRLPVRGNDEFAYVSSRFNAMLDRLENAFNRLAESHDAQRRLIADASHELKTPLTTIKGRVGMALKNPQTSERYVTHLQSIARASDRMSIIIKDLLFLARSDEDQLQLHRESCLIHELISDAIGMADPTRKSDVAIEVAEDLAVEVDPELMGRALANLLSNAFRYTTRDKKVTIKAIEYRGNVHVDVMDNGDGIPAEHLPHVFDRFYRVDASRNRGSGGTGLGLPIVRSIIEAHGGQVSISSQVGKGTTVTIIFLKNANPVEGK